ncbi:unnamed protein product [Adineta ricciae]|uniref:Uncharacterized protein n=1 Tax=Adineta ricciae TaxID=249248 RepID=A0A813ZC18_ADIRI|nr:unnamed protein product [Adineta ricciae]
MTNPGRNFETMKKFDESFRHQSLKLFDKFRKNRYSPKSTPEGAVKLNDVCNTMAAEEDNPSTPIPTNPEDLTMRRRSSLTLPLEFQLQANTILKPKGILKLSDRTYSASNICCNSPKKQENPRYTNSIAQSKHENNNENQPRSDSDCSNPSTPSISTKLAMQNLSKYRRKKFNPDNLADSVVSEAKSNASSSNV